MIQNSNLHSFDPTSSWFNSSSVRIKPRRIFKESDSAQGLFPLIRQPLAIHPMISDCGEECIQFILLQTAYRYMYEIATLEIETVNSAALKIVTNKHNFIFSPKVCQQAMSVIVDEAYHAYVALDFIQQVEKVTNVNPIFLPKDNAVQRVLESIKNSDFYQHYDLLELVTVCLTEHILTKDLVYFKRESSDNNFFNEVMLDHLSDEGRHAGYFSQVLKYLWENVSIVEKKIISRYLPILIDGYIDTTSQKEYEIKLLIHIGLSDLQVSEIIFDTYIYRDKNLDLAVINFLDVLKKTNLLECLEVKKQLFSSGFNI